MPSKRRRITITNRGRKKKQESSSPSPYIYLRTSYEANIERCDSDIRTIPDHTFGKIYSTQTVSHTQIIKEISSPNTSLMVEPEVIASSIEKLRKNKSKKKKENNRKFT